MKQYTGEKIEARNKYNNGALCTNPSDEQSVEAMQLAIDKANEKAVKGGWKAEQWLICRHSWMIVSDDNGIFVSSEETVEALELYPEKI